MATTIDLVTLGLLRELTSGDAIVTLAAEPQLSAFGEPDDAVLEAQLFLQEHLATAEPDVVARHALPEGSEIITVDVILPREDLTRRWNITTPISFSCLMIPTLPNAKGVRDRWVVVLALGHTFYLRAEELNKSHEAIGTEVKRIVAARELGTLDYLELLPARNEHLVKLDVTVQRMGGAELTAGANRQRRIAELEAKRHAIAVLDSIADALHAGIPLGRVEPQPFPLRDAEIESLRTMLAGKDRASVLVLGQERVGKSGVIRAWLEREHELNRPRLVYRTSGARLVAGMSGFGQWQERVRRVMDAAELVDAIIYFDDLADLFADRPGGHVDIPSAMRPWLEDGRVRVVGELREDQLDRCEAQNGGFFANFGRVRVEPLTAKNAITILEELNVAQEKKDPERPRLTSDGIRSLVELAERYLPYEGFPGKAVRLAREIVAAREIALGSNAANARVGSETVHEAFSIRTGVPTFLLKDESSLRVEDVFADLAKRLVGQDEAVRRVAELVCVVKAGLQPAGKPLATLLFVGPTGVGKTELARALATLLFGGDDRLVRFDMSEYASAYATERLFRGNDGGEGLLTRKVREQPFCVILLDEIEKAHPAAFDLLLQVCGEGRLTDGRGKTAYFHNAILIMTSNLGAAHRRAGTGFGVAHDAGAREKADEAHYAKVVRETFRPEMVNRIDRVISFRSLGHDDIQAVAKIATARAGRRRGIVERGIDLAVTESATAHLGATGMSDAYGARALRRHVERELVTPVARLISGRANAIEGERIIVAPSGTQTLAGEEPGEEQSGLRFGIVHLPARRSNNAAYALREVARIRRNVHVHMRLDRVQQLCDQAAFLVAQLGYGANKKKKQQPQLEGAEIAQMSADHARYAELLGALDERLQEVFALEELALAAYVAGEDVEPFKNELAEPVRQFRAVLLRALVAEEPKKNTISLMIMELDGERAFDLWLIPLLHHVETRRWTVNVHLDADKERANTGWPESRRWGPPLTPEQAIPRLASKERTFRNVLLTVEGDHARMWLGLEAGTHVFSNIPSRADTKLHVSILAHRAHLTDTEWTPPNTDPPNAQAADALGKLPPTRMVDGLTGRTLLLNNFTLPIALKDYWPSFDEIALEHLLLYERNRVPGQTRDTQYKPLLDDSMADVRDLINKGMMINAIKLYREKTGSGLKEAKDAVEAMR